MLSQLYIQNFAVIKEAAIDLRAGFNVFTGETGAGKSILIGAINAVLGERTSREIIRTGEESASVSAVFYNVAPSVVAALQEMGLPAEEGEELLLSREISLDGRTSCRINGRPVTVSMVREIASDLINIHGQKDSQKFITSDKHMRFVDSFGRLEEDLAAYRESYRKVCDIKASIDELTMDEAQKAHKIDLLQYQVQEISSAGLVDGEEEELLAQHKMIRNREKIVSALSQAAQLMCGSEDREGLDDLFSEFSGQVEEAARYVERLVPTSSRLQEMGYELSDCGSMLNDLLEEMEYDPEQAEEVESRLDLLKRLKMKYGQTIPEILAFLDNAREELDSITFSQERLDRLQEEYTAAYTEAYRLASELSFRRKQAGREFVARVEEELTFLDMPAVQLQCEFRSRDLCEDGIDDMELFITTNPGEPPRSLAKTASGGELSRVMLSIKNVMADRDGVDTLIFDEVDTGVSGRAAQKIGRKLKEVSRNRQVICVTHLAQVAAFGDNHLLISKTVENDRTFTQVVHLDEEQRVEELARIIGGDSITPNTLQSARELLEQGANV